MSYYRKEFLFFLEKLDLDRFKREYEIVVPIAIGPLTIEHIIARVDEFDEYGFSRYVSQFSRQAERLRLKTYYDLLREQGYPDREIWLWAQIHDAEGKRLANFTRNLVPIAEMSSEHIRQCMQMSSLSIESYNAFEEELEYRKRGN